MGGAALERIRPGDLTCYWEVVEHFGVPNEVVWLQPPLVFDWGAEGKLNFVGIFPGLERRWMVCRHAKRPL